MSISDFKPYRPAPKFDARSVDAAHWAQHFVARARVKPTFAQDEGNMIGWFANAIMAGYDHARALLSRQPKVHLMECLACHVYGTPIDPLDKTCGNCGATDTRIWWRLLEEEAPSALPTAAASSGVPVVVLHEEPSRLEQVETQPPDTHVVPPN